MGRAPDDLFDFMRSHSHTKEALARILGWVDRIKERFTSFIALSIALHITVFGLLAVSQSSTPNPQAAAAGRDDAKAIRLAIDSLRLDAKESAILSEALASLTEEDIEDIIERSPELDPRLEERERTEIFRSLMKESLARLGEKKGGRSALDAPSWDLLLGSGESDTIRLAEGDRLFRFENDTEGKSRLYRLPAKTAQKLESLQAVGEKEKEWREVRGGQVELRTEHGYLRVLEEYYFRECPYEQMLALGGSLFYAVAGFPRFDVPETTKPVTEGANDTSVVPGIQTEKSQADREFAFVFIPAPRPRDRDEAESTPVPFPALSEENIPEILDGLMELVDEDQVRAYTERYLDGSDPDNPVLAQLTQDFLYGNLGNVFILGDELSTAFDFLEELFYNKRFQNTLVTYGFKNRGSRTGAEVLFCLAALYDFEKRGLDYLADSLDQIEAVLGDKSGKFEVFNKQAKAFVLKEVYRDFVFGIWGRGREDLDLVLREYREEQARIYRLLMDTGGEAKNRALYALGGMYWDDGLVDQALKTWEQIETSYSHPTLADIRWIMSMTSNSELRVSRINALFQEESRKSSSGNLARLKKFRIWEKRSAKLRADGVDEQ